VLTSVHGFSSEEACNEKKADEGSSGVKIGRSYADVVRSQSGEVKVGFRSTQGSVPGGEQLRGGVQCLGGELCAGLLRSGDCFNAGECGPVSGGASFSV
jgi:hypothetical protein